MGHAGRGAAVRPDDSPLRHSGHVQAGSNGSEVTGYASRPRSVEELTRVHAPGEDECRQPTDVSVQSHSSFWQRNACLKRAARVASKQPPEAASAV
jgi:hypothetical protein